MGPPWSPCYACPCAPQTGTSRSPSMHGSVLHSTPAMHDSVHHRQALLGQSAPQMGPPWSPSYAHPSALLPSTARPPWPYRQALLGLPAMHVPVYHRWALLMQGLPVTQGFPVTQVISVTQGLPVTQGYPVMQKASLLRKDLLAAPFAQSFAAQANSLSTAKQHE
eukprot:1158477-Pelagomonas_calceolata.AAC.3